MSKDLLSGLQPIAQALRLEHVERRASSSATVYHFKPPVFHSGQKGLRFQCRALIVGTAS